MSKPSSSSNTKTPSQRTSKTTVRRFLGLRKQSPSEGAPLPGAFRLFWRSLNVYRTYWKVFLGITAIYGVLTILFVRGLSGGASLEEIKATLESAGNLNQFITGATLFAYLLGTSGNTSSDVAGAYQLGLTLLASLAIIWSLRQAYAGNAIRIRDGFYRGMYPLVPFMLVLLVVCLQLLPALIGTYLYSTASASGIATGLAAGIWGVAVFVLVLISLYLLASSLLALYIVCLPDMQPLAALRSARQLVRHRRFEIMRKLLFLPCILLVLAALIMIPIIMVATPLAPWIFFILSTAGLLVAHSYMYYLYRTLLGEGK